MRGQSNKIRKALRGKKANMTKRKKKKGGKTRRGRKKNRSNFKRFTDLNKQFTDLMEKVIPISFLSIYWKDVDVDCYITIPDKLLHKCK